MYSILSHCLECALVGVTNSTNLGINSPADAIVSDKMLA